MLLFSENEVDKPGISDDPDSIWTDEDEDLPNSDSTDGKNMLLPCITVQRDKKKPMTKLPVQDCFQDLTALARP